MMASVGLNSLGIRNVTDLFKDIITSILQSKKYSFEDDKSYVPFVVNKALSYHQDTIFLSNEMNRYWQLDNRMQYDFLFHSVRGYKRPYFPWPKQVKNEDLEAVKTFFGYSERRSLEILNILTNEQLMMIKENNNRE